jgi:sigma-B regulation protein RsbU (phosphoserine phosphatase)
MSEKVSKETQDYLTSVLEIFPIATWLIDENRDILYMNAEMRGHFGDLTGQNADILFTEGDLRVGTNLRNNNYKEVVLSDVTYRQLSGSFPSPEGGQLSIETFEDISEEKSIQKQDRTSLERLKKDLAIARSIQKSLLPANGRYGGAIDYYAIYRPAEDVGGDFLDIFALDETDYIFYIADVAGHGIQASLLTIFVREQIRAAATHANGADAILRSLLRSYTALNIDPTIYLTALVCRYNPKSRELRACNAGHGCFPLIVRKGGRVENVPIKGMPISVISDEDSYEEEVFRLDGGERLILYTDGIVEEFDAAKGAALGAEGLRKIVEQNHSLSGHALANLVMSESSKYITGSARDDRSIAIVDVAR